MPESLIGRKAALLRKQKVNRVTRDEGKWNVVGLVTITNESPSNVYAGSSCFDRKTWHMRESGPASKTTSLVRISWDPGEIKLGHDAEDQRNQVQVEKTRKEQERREWLEQPRPKLANQIVGKIQAADTEPMVRALAEHLCETELQRVLRALEFGS